MYALSQGSLYGYNKESLKLDPQPNIPLTTNILIIHMRCIGHLQIFKMSNQYQIYSIHI